MPAPVDSASRRDDVGNLNQQRDRLSIEQSRASDQNGNDQCETDSIGQTHYNNLLEQCRWN